MNADQLLHSMKIQYGIPPDECTTTNLAKFLDAYRDAGRRIGDDRRAWNDVVGRLNTFFPGAGSYKYGSQDHTDLKAAATNLLAALQQKK
jgi:hypothetical protein